MGGAVNRSNNPARIYSWKYINSVPVSGGIGHRRHVRHVVPTSANIYSLLVKHAWQ